MARQISQGVPPSGHPQSCNFHPRRIIVCLDQGVLRQLSLLGGFEYAANQLLNLGNDNYYKRVQIRLKLAPSSVSCDRKEIRVIGQSKNYLKSFKPAEAD